MYAYSSVFSCRGRIEFPEFTQKYMAWHMSTFMHTFTHSSPDTMGRTKLLWRKVDRIAKAFLHAKQKCSHRIVIVALSPFPLSEPSFISPIARMWHLHTFEAGNPVGKENPAAFDNTHWFFLFNAYCKHVLSPLSWRKVGKYERTLYRIKSYIYCHPDI